MTFNGPFQPNPFYDLHKKWATFDSNPLDCCPCGPSLPSSPFCWEWLLGGQGNHCQAAPKTFVCCVLGSQEMSAADSAGAHCVLARRHRQLSERSWRQPSRGGEAGLCLHHWKWVGAAQHLPQLSFCLQGSSAVPGVEFSELSSFPSCLQVAVDVLFGNFELGSTRGKEVVSIYTESRSLDLLVLQEHLQPGWGSTTLGCAARGSVSSFLSFEPFMVVIVRAGKVHFLLY